jgi:hypothetical protein
MKSFRRGLFLVILYGVGFLEVHYLERFGLPWLLTALGATAFLAGFWMRRHWDS